MLDKHVTLPLPPFSNPTPTPAVILLYPAHFHIPPPKRAHGNGRGVIERCFVRGDLNVCLCVCQEMGVGWWRGGYLERCCYLGLILTSGAQAIIINGSPRPPHPSSPFSFYKVERPSWHRVVGESSSKLLQWRAEQTVALNSTNNNRPKKKRKLEATYQLACLSCRCDFNEKGRRARKKESRTPSCETIGVIT